MCYIVVTSNNIPEINLLKSCSEETLFSCLKTAEANHFWAHSRPQRPALKAPNLTVTQIGSLSPWGGSELKPSLHSDSPREVIWEGSGQARARVGGGISVPWRRGQRAFVHSGTCHRRQWSTCNYPCFCQTAKTPQRFRLEFPWCFQIKLGF